MGPIVNEPDERIEYLVYREHRKYLIDSAYEQIKSFDKAVLTLSSGALGLSMIFLKDIVDIKLMQFKYLLYVSWLLYIGAIAANLISYKLSLHDFQREIGKIDRSQLNGQPYQTGKNPFRWLTQFANYGALVLFSVATGSLVTFAIYNLL